MSTDTPTTGFEVYDFRTVNRNVLVTPEIRARLYHMKPGQVDGRHSHDLGHEIFLILEGLAEFNINGVKKELGPGQMCVALADEIHQVRNLLPDQPTIMYLSVTPHIHPTHTGRTLEGEKVPPHFIPNANYHAEQDMDRPMRELLAAQVEAAGQVLAAAQANLATQQAEMQRALEAMAAGDRQGAVAARNAMWESVYTLHKQLSAFDALWNEAAPRIAHEAS
jgi:quercetin dioxygenase-like cupin family protein